MPTAEVDWDFSNANWKLDDSQYVSEPKSLNFTAVHSHTVVLCKHEGTTCLPQGRIITQARIHHVSFATLIFTFRNQRAVGGSDYNNCYRLQISSRNRWLFERIVGGAGTVISSGSGFLNGWTWPSDTWVKVRCTWWEEGGVLYVRVERWTGTEWTKLLNDMNDPNNLWSASEINRCGLWIWRDTDSDNGWIDDTEIWGP